MDDQRREIAVALLKAGTAVLEGANPHTVIERLGGRLREVGLGPSGGPPAPPRAAEAPRAAEGATLAVVAPSGRPEAAQVALVVEPVEPAPVRRVDPYRDGVIEVFNHWRTQTGHEAAKLTPDRIQKVRARLREGYSVVDLKRAIDGCVASPFHSGENDRGTRYDDLTLICRTGSKVEYFRELAGPAQYETPAAAPKRSDESIAHETKVRELKAQARELLKQGRHDEYADAIRSIRELDRQP